jgi:hypothetical protein
LKELEVWTEEMNQRTNMVNSERSYLSNSNIIQGNLKRDSLNMFVRALDFWRIRNVTMNAELIKVMREQHKHYSTRQELEKRVNDIATLMSGIRTVTNATSPQPITQIIVSIMSEVTASSDVSINYSGVNNTGVTTVNAASVAASSYLLDMTATADRDLNEFVTTSTNMLRVEYEITLKYTIESDNKPRNVIIQSKNIPTVYTYSVIPKLDLDVFLMARITDWEDMNLIPGEARIYFDNSFIGNTFINPQNINDTLQLNFGRDKSIVVSRTKVKDKCKEKFMNENKFSEKTYEIAIRNTKSMPIRVVVEDQMPVTRDPAIKIEYTENSNATKFNPETGKLTWDLNIKSKDTKKLVFKYEVKHPKDKVLSVF